jgi:hypothetical protein
MKKEMGGRKFSTARRSLGIEIGIAYPLSFTPPSPPTPPPPNNISTPSLLQNLLYFYVSASFYFSPLFLLFLSFCTD